MRKLGIALAIIVGVIIAVALIAPAFINVNQYHGRIQSLLEQQLQRPVSLGNMHLSLLPTAVRVDNVSVADDPQFATGKPFASASQLYVRVQLLPLLHKDIAIDSLELVHPQIELVRDQRGVWNFSSIGKSKSTPQQNEATWRGHEQVRPPAAARGTTAAGDQREPSQTKAAAPPQTPSAPAQSNFSLGHLKITDGQVAVTDEQKHQPRAVYDHIDVDLANFAPSRSFSVDLRAHLPGPGAETIALTGDAGPIADQPEQTPVSGKLTLDNVALSSLTKFVNVPALAGLDGILSGNASLKDAGGKMNAEGSLRLNDGRAPGGEFGFPISADFNLNGDVNADTFDLQKVDLTLGDTHISTSGRLNLQPTPAQIQFTLNANKIDAGQWQRMMSGSGSQPQRQTSTRSAAASPLANISGGGNVTVGSIIYDQIVLSDVHATVSLNQGVVRLAPLSAMLFGGRENGEMVIDTRANPPTVSMSSNLQQVDANKLLSSVSSVKNTLYGLLTSNAQLSFSPSGSTDIARTLNGSLALDLRNGRLANIDMLQQLASVGKFLNAGGTGKAFTDLVQMTGNFDIKNGVATTNNLKTVIDGGTLAATGAANLVDQTLDMHLTAVLTKALSEKVGGTQVGGFMNTALANNNGELVLPVLLTGGFQSPHIAPDVQRIAQMRLNHLLPTSSNPGQLTSGLLGALSKKGAAGGGLQSILGDVTGHKNSNSTASQPNGQASQPASQAQGSQTQKKRGLGGLLDQINSAAQKQQQPQQNQQSSPPK